jgi:hypothetical protein
MPKKNQVKGGAATAISADGDIKVVFKLDKAWIVSTIFSYFCQLD